MTNRIIDKNAIYHIVNIHIKNPEEIEYPFVRIGESSYYSLLYVDKRGLLQKVDDKFNETSMEPICSCCTHTFNGKKFTKKYQK